MRLNTKIWLRRLIWAAGVGPAVTDNNLIIRHRGEGDRLWFTGGGMHTWKATAEETGGAFLCFEDQMTAGKFTPLHAHPGIHEVLYVLDGEIRVWDDGAERAVTTGGFVLVQPGAAHAFLTVQPTRLLCVQTPGDGQAFFRATSDPAAAGQVDGPLDAPRVRAATREHPGGVFLAPPPFA